MKLHMRIIATILALALCFTMVSTQSIEGFMDLLRNAEAATNYTYVSDIQMARGSSAESTKKQLTDNGYTVVDQDMNNGTGSDYVYMGYKTSDNEEDAITDLKVMSMDDGYRMVKYSDVMAATKSNAEDIVDDLRVALDEFKSNYSSYKSNGSYPLAGAAWDLLGLYESDGTALNTFLTKTASDTELRNAIMLCSGDTTNLIYNALLMGCADSSDSDNWATRAGSQAQLYADTKDLSTTSAWKPYDTKYYTNASIIAAAAQSFASLYNEAKERKSSGDQKLDSVPSGAANTTSVEEAMEALENNVDEAADDDSSADALVLAAYKTLNNYSYSYFTSGQKLGEFLVEMGSISTKKLKTANIRKFYELAAAMTEGQVSLLEYKSLTELAMMLGQENSDGRARVEDSVSLVAKKMQETLGTSQMSIWEGVDRDLYNREVALTSTAARQASMRGSYDVLTADDEMEVRVDLMKKYGEMCLYFSMGLYSLAGIGIATGATTVISAIWSGAALSSIFTAGIVSGICAIVSAVAVVGIVLSLCVLAAAGIIWLIHKFRSKKVTLTDIPYELHDINDGVGVKYLCATDASGTCVDINAAAGTQWNALYISHNTDNGSPLIANPENIDDVFCALTGAAGSTTPEGKYVPLTNFEENQPFNLNRYAKKDNCDGIYCYYHTVDSINGKDSTAEARGTYLSDLKVFSEESAEAAQKKAVLEGFTLFDHNLCPNADDYYYLGYKTTTKVANAIRDIRVAANCTSDELHFGEVSYGKCGELAGCSIYASAQNTLAGDPIYADLQYVTSRSDAKTGWEPVNLFCGGDAFDLSSTSDTEKEDNVWDENSYIYFHPTTLYTSGQLYISGYAFAEGGDVSGYDFSSLMDYTGFQELSAYTENLLNHCIASDILNETEGQSRILYSTTYNPHRAITNIKLYTGNPDDGAVPETVCYGSVTYAACEVFRQWKEGYNSWKKNDLCCHRGTLASNSYLPSQASEGRYFTWDGDERDPNGLNEKGDYSDHVVTPLSLMVCGPQSNVDPIKVSDMFYSSTYMSEEALQKKISGVNYTIGAATVNSTNVSSVISKTKVGGAGMVNPLSGGSTSDDSSSSGSSSSASGKILNAFSSNWISNVVTVGTSSTSTSSDLYETGTTYYERVSDMMSQYPNTSAATNLTWEFDVPTEKDGNGNWIPTTFNRHLYMYILREAEDVDDARSEGPEYISSIDISKEDGDTTSILTGLAEGSSDPTGNTQAGEVIRVNLTQKSSKQSCLMDEDGRAVWTDESCDGAVYMKVERTNLKVKAIRDVIVCKVSGTTPEKSMTKDGCKYSLVKIDDTVEGSVIEDPKGITYAIYTTTSAAAGEPITRVSAGRSASGTEDAVSATNENGENLKTYWHVQYAAADTYPKVVNVMSVCATGSDHEDAQTNARDTLAANGANMTCDTDIAYNYNDSGTRAYYIGYTSTHDEDAVPFTDIRIFRGTWKDTSDSTASVSADKNADNTAYAGNGYVELDGIRYYRLTDDLNSGFGGSELYIVATTDPTAAEYRGLGSGAYITKLAVTEDGADPISDGDWIAVSYLGDDDDIANLRDGASDKSGCSKHYYDYTLWVQFANTTDNPIVYDENGYLASAFTNNPQLLALLIFALVLLGVAAGMVIYRRRRIGM